MTASDSNVTPGADGPSAACMALFAAGYGALAAPVVWAGELPSSVLVPTLILGAVLALLSAIDFTTFRLPDVLTIPLAALGIGFAWWQGWDDPLVRTGAAAGAYIFMSAVSLAYHRLRERDGLGSGDAKLLAAAGAWTGIGGLPSVLLYACATALLGFLYKALRGNTLTSATRIAFGPFLAFGTWIVWLYGPLG